MLYTPERPEIVAYMENLTNGTHVDLPVLPEEISDDYSANFENLPVMGRSSPYVGYSGGGPRTVSFSLTLHADYCNGDLLGTIRKLKSMAYPEYEDYVDPPEILFRLGDFILIRGYCDSVSVNWQSPYGKDQNGNTIYYLADVSISLGEAVKIAFSASDIIEGVSYDFSS